MLFIVTETGIWIYWVLYEPTFILVQVYSTCLQRQWVKSRNIQSTEILIFLQFFSLWISFKHFLKSLFNIMLKIFLSKFASGQLKYFILVGLLVFTVFWCVLLSGLVFMLWIISYYLYITVTFIDDGYYRWCFSNWNDNWFLACSEATGILIDNLYSIWYVRLHFSKCEVITK